MPNLFALLRPTRWFPAACSVVALGCLSATAALAADGGEGKQGGLPQLDPSVFARQIFWLVIAFVVLYWLLVKRALPVVESVLEERRTTIAGDLEAATKARDEAAAAAARLDKVMAEARAAAQAHVAEIIATADADARSRQQAQAGSIAARVTEAEARVAAARAEALANVRVAAADIATDIVQKLAGIVPDAGTTDATVAAIIKERG